MVQLTDDQHYIRYGSSSNMDEEGNVSPLVFRLDSDGVSGDHFESNDNDYQKVLNSLKKRGFSTKKTGFFVKLNCGEVIHDPAVKKQKCIISFEKNTKDESHTLMKGLNGYIPVLLVHHLIKEIKRISDH